MLLFHKIYNTSGGSRANASAGPRLPVSTYDFGKNHLKNGSVTGSVRSRSKWAEHVPFGLVFGHLSGVMRRPARHFV